MHSYQQKTFRSWFFLPVQPAIMVFALSPQLLVALSDMTQEGEGELPKSGGARQKD